MKIFFLSFFFAKLDKIREIHGNQSVWLEVADIDNGMHEFTIKIITLHRSILPIYPSEHGSVFFFFLLKVIQNTLKMFQRFIFQ